MNWALEEFEEISLGDELLNKRAGKILSCLGDKPSLSIPGSCKGWDETMALVSLTISAEEGCSVIRWLPLALKGLAWGGA